MCAIVVVTKDGVGEDDEFRRVKGAHDHARKLYGFAGHFGHCEGTDVEEMQVVVRWTT